MIKQERNVEIVRKRQQGATLQSIADEYGITKERVRQIVHRELKKMNLLPCYKCPWRWTIHCPKCEWNKNGDKKVY